MKFVKNHRFALIAVCTAMVACSAIADVKIGINVPLTGFAAADGKSALEGAKLAVAQANAKGGVKGEKIELVIYDDQASPKEVVPLATKLIEKDKVVGVVGGSYSGPSRAAASVFRQLKFHMLLLTPSILTLHELATICSAHLRWARCKGVAELN